MDHVKVKRTGIPFWLRYSYGEKIASEVEREAVGRERERRVTWLRALGLAERGV